MPKHLKDILQGTNASTEEPLKLPDDMILPPTKGTDDFTRQHIVKKFADRVGNGDDVYKGTTKKAEMDRHGLKDKLQKVANEENIQEISKEKLTNYGFRAKDDAFEADLAAQRSLISSRNKSYDPELRKKFADEKDWLLKIKAKREKGVALALSKLDKK